MKSLPEKLHLTTNEITSLKAKTKTLHAQFKQDLFNQVIQTNARLRKAGDAMRIGHEANLNGYPYSDKMINKSLDDWNAAKEGKPSV